MKILNVFNRYLERGGEEGAVEQICDSLGNVVELTRCDFASAEWQGPCAPGIWQQALRMIHNPLSAAKLKACEQIRQSDAWLVHNVFPVASGAVYTEAKKFGVPVIQYLHNFRPYSVNGYLWAGGQLEPAGLSRNFWPEIRRGAWQESRVKTAWFAFVLSLGHTLGWYREIKAWIAVSDFMRARFVAAGVPATKIFTLRHFWRPKSDSVWSRGQHYLFLGRLIEAKGLQVLLDAWEILRRELGPAAPHLVIGGDGPLRLAVEERSRRTPNVTYVGELTGLEKNDALENARAVIVPSLWWEALGLVGYEAFDYSRPVLAARSGGLSEIVSDHETGLLHEPGNARQLAQHVMELERNSGLAATMGKAGRRWLLENASEAEWQRRFLKIAAFALEASP